MAPVQYGDTVTRFGGPSAAAYIEYPTVRQRVKLVKLQLVS